MTSRRRTPKPIADNVVSADAMVAIATLALFGELDLMDGGYRAFYRSKFYISVFVAEELDLAGYAELSVNRLDGEDLGMSLSITDAGRALLTEALV